MWAVRVLIGKNGGRENEGIWTRFAVGDTGGRELKIVRFWRSEMGNRGEGTEVGIWKCGRNWKRGVWSLLGWRAEGE